MFQSGYIKLFRSILSWEWYQDANTARLFVHLLLTVGINNEKWQGIKVPRGSRVASISVLSKELKMSPKQVRTSLEKLISTNEVASTKYPKFTVFTIVRWNDYQAEGQASGKQNGKHLGNQSDKQNGKQDDKKAASKTATSNCAESHYNTSVTAETEIPEGKQKGNQTASKRADKGQSNRQPDGQANGQQNKNIRIQEEEKEYKEKENSAVGTDPVYWDGPPPKGTPEYERWRNQ